MKDFLVLGTEIGWVVDPDGSSSFAQSVEDTSRIALITKAFAPMTHAGDIVWRRAYLTVHTTSGFSLRIRPLIDGRESGENAKVFNVPSPVAGSQRHTLTLPFGQSTPGRPGTRGLRGSAMQLVIESRDARSGWSLESAEFVFVPGLRSK